MRCGPRSPRVSVIGVQVTSVPSDRAAQSHARELVGTVPPVDEQGHPYIPGHYAATGRDCPEDRTIPVAQLTWRHCGHDRYSFRSTGSGLILHNLASVVLRTVLRMAPATLLGHWGIPTAAGINPPTEAGPALPRIGGPLRQVEGSHHRSYPASVTTSPIDTTRGTR